MTISTVECLEGIAEQRKAEARETEAWRIAQIAATLCGGAHAIGRGVDAKSSVEAASRLLAKSRRQAGAAAGGEAGRVG